MANFTTAAEAVRLIKSFDKIYIQGSTSVPNVLVEAMTARGDELRGVEIYAGFAVSRGDAPYLSERYADSFFANSFFVANNVRRGIAEGYGSTIPCFLGEVPALVREGFVKYDVCLLNVSEPDADGYCSYGISADLAVSAVETAKIIIAQVNPRIPYTYGDALVHIDRIDACVRVDQEPLALPTVVPNDVESRIGNFIAAEIPDGATLQIGVGGIPNAVLAALTNHCHLGVHTEALTDGIVPLIENGTIDNSCKTVMKGVTVASLALGSRRLYDFMDYNKSLLVKDVAWTNYPFRIAQNPRVMAINSAVEVDLTGQVCADSVGTRIISGVGGQHDFMYGGSLSEGGKTFIAIPSMTEKGFSKIRPVLTQGAGVVTTRFQTQFVVTEWGAAFLKGKNLIERAKALIAIADPSVREELSRAARERFGRAFR